MCGGHGTTLTAATAGQSPSGVETCDSPTPGSYWQAPESKQPAESHEAHGLAKPEHIWEGQNKKDSMRGTEWVTLPLRSTLHQMFSLCENSCFSRGTVAQ